MKIKDDWYAQNLAAGLSHMQGGLQTAAYAALLEYYGHEAEICTGPLYSNESRDVVGQDFTIHYYEEEWIMEMDPNNVPPAIAGKISHVLEVGTVVVILAIMLSCIILMIAAS